jgi:hypothetical protein
MTFAPKSPEVAVKRYPAVGIELLRKKVKALTAFNAVDKLHSVARQKRTGQYQYAPLAVYTWPSAEPTDEDGSRRVSRRLISGTKRN